MEDERILKETVIQEGDFLTPKITAVTAASKVTEEGEKYFLYNYIRVELVIPTLFKGAVRTEKQYLRGHVEGIEQEINLELPAAFLEEEAAIKSFHELAIMYAEATKTTLGLLAVAKMAGID